MTIGSGFKDYKILGKKGEGTFSEVLKCQNIKDGKLYAMKVMKQHYENMEQVQNIREIQAMKKLNHHPNIVTLFDIIYDKKNGQLALILELMDMNAYEMIRGRKQLLPENKVKHYMWQLCCAVEHIHKNGIFHRDVKPENILIKEDALKLADFGSCRSLNSRQPFTEYISTRWYRAPECLLTDGYYGYQMDCWSVGCVMFEIMSLRPLFPGSNEVDQISKIHDVLGTPSGEVINKFKNKSRSVSLNFPPKRGIGLTRLTTHMTPEGGDLISKLCEYDPDRRLTAAGALKHPYFHEYRHRQINSETEIKELAAPQLPQVLVNIWKKKNELQPQRQQHQQLSPNSMTLISKTQLVDESQERHKESPIIAAKSPTEETTSASHAASQDAVIMRGSRLWKAHDGEALVKPNDINKMSHKPAAGRKHLHAKRKQPTLTMSDDLSAESKSKLYKSFLPKLSQDFFTDQTPLTNHNSHDSPTDKPKVIGKGVPYPLTGIQEENHQNSSLHHQQSSSFFDQTLLSPRHFRPAPRQSNGHHLEPHFYVPPNERRLLHEGTWIPSSTLMKDALNLRRRFHVQQPKLEDISEADHKVRGMERRMRNPFFPLSHPLPRRKNQPLEQSIQSKYILPNLNSISDATSKEKKTSSHYPDILPKEH